MTQKTWQAELEWEKSDVALTELMMQRKLGVVVSTSRRRAAGGDNPRSLCENLEKGNHFLKTREREAAVAKEGRNRDCHGGSG